MLNESLKNGPNHVEKERLFDDVHFFQSDGHGVLDEGEKALAEADAQSHDLLHGQVFEVHEHNHPSDLGLFFYEGRYVD